MIYGSSGEDMQWIFHESGERYISELSLSFQTDLDNWLHEEIPALDFDFWYITKCWKEKNSQIDGKIYDVLHQEIQVIFAKW